MPVTTDRPTETVESIEDAREFMSEGPQVRREDALVVLMGSRWQLRPTDIAEFFGRSQTWAGMVFDDLSSRGFIETRDDSRERIARLTEEGRERAEELVASRR